ncbi:MAG: response regulator [Desulfovibrio sp.]|nr:response regulator [Desulfovibrio sp.]
MAQRTMALTSINKVLLGSLDCHTEREVMVRCLDQARIIAGSDQAFLGRIGGDGRLDVLLTASPDTTDAQWTVEQLGEMRLEPEQMVELRSGKVTCSGIEGRVYFVAVPLNRAGAEEARAIAVVRRNRPYLSSEAALLAEVLFAFEEALHRKRTEISLHDKERQLERAQRMEALGTLAGGIAHDFNNILGVIIANGEMIELFHLGDDPQLETKTKALLTAAYRGRDLVSQILSFARKGTEEVRLLTVGPIIRETVKFLGASLPASISIASDIRQPEPSVLANPTQVHQVLMNLCTNAAQAMRVEGGQLRIALFSEDVPPGPDVRQGGYLVLAVSDTGPGIPPEILERIFDPFFTTKSQGEGTGLGLAVVDGIVKSWGGVVRVHSETGKGSCFQVYLPVSQKQPGALPAACAAEEFPGGSGRVLFVDDERELASSCAAFLNRLGYTVETVSDGRTALTLFNQARERFDIVVTDFSMPGLRGDRLAREMLAARPDLPIILCTGFSHSFGEADATASGIKAYLKKPVNLRELAACVSRHILRHD